MSPNWTLRLPPGTFSPYSPSGTVWPVCLMRLTTLEFQYSRPTCTSPPTFSPSCGPSWGLPWPSGTAPSWGRVSAGEQGGQCDSSRQQQTSGRSFLQRNTISSKADHMVWQTCLATAWDPHFTFILTERLPTVTARKNASHLVKISLINCQLYWLYERYLQFYRLASIYIYWSYLLDISTILQGDAFVVVLLVVGGDNM